MSGLDTWEPSSRLPCWAASLGQWSRVIGERQILIQCCLPFVSTVQFVGITAFHTQIADPLIGGTYMTVSDTVKMFRVYTVLI